MSTHRYPASSLYADHLRGAFGLAMTGGPLLLLDVASPVGLVLASLAALFVWFELRTGLRQMSSIEVSPEAITLRGPIGRRLAWAHLDRLRLAYYAPRRARSEGWLQLTLRGAGGPIRVDSTIEGFDHVLQRAVAAAAARDLVLDPTTQANLATLGLGGESAQDADLMHAPSRGARSGSARAIS